MKILLSLIFVFSTASVFGDLSLWGDHVNVRPSWSGSWFNPEQSGHGISVEVLDEERTVIYWYTYDQDGKPIWLIAPGINNYVPNSQVWASDLPSPGITVEATAYYYEGMIYGDFDPATNNRREWGTIELDFTYWDCEFALMTWYPVMEGFSQGSTLLRRLTTLNNLDCVYGYNTVGNWEVQFGFDAEHKYQVEIVSTPNPEPDPPTLTFEFFDENDCLWSGRVSRGFMLRADWGNQCGATAMEHSGNGIDLFEHKLCDSENECTRKDEVMLFEDNGEYLIFSR
jgi:hypothetical protein